MPPVNRKEPELLQEFVAWLRPQTDKSLGYFDPILQPAKDHRWPGLKDAASVFLRLPDGSDVIALATGHSNRKAVVLLGSEGEVRLVAQSFEAFLIQWANGETGIGELDESSAEGRQKLARWIAKGGIIEPKAEPFDLNARLTSLRS